MAVAEASSVGIAMVSLSPVAKRHYLGALAADDSNAAAGDAVMYVCL